MYINNERMSMQETEADAKSGPFLYVSNDERLQVGINCKFYYIGYFIVHTDRCIIGRYDRKTVN